MSFTTSSIIITEPLTNQEGIFEKIFPKSIELTGEEQIGIQNFSIYYSIDNISSNFNNNSISYIFNGQTYTVNFPDGYYQMSDINSFIRLAMKTAGHYLVDNTGKEVYFFTIQTNTVYYTNTLTLDVVPSVLPVGWANPTNMTLTGQTMQLNVNNSAFGKILGFVNGIYPAAPSNTKYQKNSDKTPEITPVSFVYVHCDFVNDTRFDNYTSDVIGQIIITDAKRGGLYSLNPQTITFFPVQGGRYSRIRIRLTDQNNKPLVIRDKSAILIALLLRQPNTQSN